ncbi:MAG: hypothetical protein U1E27_00160, partial [Kiritimatiellia bacterium]|nr:hypothetical protein [Kiritimatiellia bacterium]
MQIEIVEPPPEYEGAESAYRVTRTSGNASSSVLEITYPPRDPEPPVELAPYFDRVSVYSGSAPDGMGGQISETIRIRRTLESLEDSTVVRRHILEAPETQSPPLEVSESRTTYLGDYRTVVEKLSILDPDGLAITNRTDYYTDPLQEHSFQKTRRNIRSDGSWIEYEYNLLGQLAVQRTGYLDAPVDQPQAVEETLYSYTPVSPADDGTNPGRPRQVTRTVAGQIVSRDYTVLYVEQQPGANPILTVIHERASTPDAVYGASGNSRAVNKTWGRALPDAPEAGQPHSSLSADGGLTRHFYEHGVYIAEDRSFTPVPNGAYLRHTTIRATEAHPDGIAGRTLRNATIVHRDRKATVATETAIYTGANYETIDWTTYEFDALGRQIRATRSDGTVEETDPACCG